MGACACKKRNIEPDIVYTVPQEVADFMKKVRPLDLLVFRGADGVSSLIANLEEKYTGKGSVSHVEVAITRDWCPKIKAIHGGLETHVVDSDQTLFSWGSTLSGSLNDGAYNAETNKTTFGVQIRVLEDLIMSYLKNPEGNVGVCRLINNPIEKKKDESPIMYYGRKQELQDSINRAYDSYNGCTYNANPIALLGSMFPVLRPLRDASDEILDKFRKETSWLFCSEFVALLYQAVGVITDETDGVADGKILDASDVLPIDFLGCDADKDGLVNAICEYPPIWIKPVKK